MASFYKKLPGGFTNFYKKVDNGINNFFKKTLPSVGSNFKQGLARANDFVNKVGNNLEKAVPLISNVGSAIASLSGNPELALGFNRASGLVQSLHQGLKAKQEKVNQFANRLTG